MPRKRKYDLKQMIEEIKTEGEIITIKAPILTQAEIRTLTRNNRCARERNGRDDAHT